jgi:hypothetical protein
MSAEKATVRLAASRAHRARVQAEAAMADFKTALDALDAAIAAMGDYKVEQVMPIAYDSLGRPVYATPSRSEIPPDSSSGESTNVVSEADHSG